MQKSVFRKFEAEEFAGGRVYHSDSVYCGGEMVFYKASLYFGSNLPPYVHSIQGILMGGLGQIYSVMWFLSALVLGHLMAANDSLIFLFSGISFSISFMIT